MLVSVTIKNFRSCADVTLENLSELTVLVGRNGAGKSNILKAIEWACSLGSGRDQKDVRRPFMRSDGASVSLNLSLLGRPYCYVAAVSWPSSIDGKPLYSESLVAGAEVERTLLRRNGSTIEVHGLADILTVSEDTSAIPAVLSLLPQLPFVDELRRVLHFLRRVEYYALDEPSEHQETALTILSDLKTWPSGKALKSELDAVLFRIFNLAIERPEDFSEWQSIIGPEGLGLVDEAPYLSFFTPDPAKRNMRHGEVGPLLKALPEEAAAKTFLFCYFGTSSDDEPLTFTQLSYGTRRLIRLFTCLIHDRPSLLMIEQPEDGIHTGLLHKVIPQLRAYADSSRQFMFASHSADIFNRMNPSEVRMVEMAAHKTRAKALSEQELASACEYMRRDGTLAEFISLVQE